MGMLRKKLSDLTPTGKKTAEEESISFDDTGTSPSVAAGADGLEFVKEKAPQDGSSEIDQKEAVPAASKEQEGDQQEKEDSVVSS
mmetsp:Transcript_102/g.252  ORF Transcript_102/g.252 Transcript_102/m.252 type:complete len:85 (+) Transcript_102:2-256(+)